MSQFARSYAIWLADFYLLATVLLAATLAGAAWLQQPARRLAVVKSSLVGVVLLAFLCALPSWSVVHLLTAQRAPEPTHAQQLEPITRPATVTIQAPLREMKEVAASDRPKVASLGVETVEAEGLFARLSWTDLIAIVHLVGTAFVFTWLALGWLAFLRLRNSAVSAPAGVVSILNELTQAERARFERVQLLTHERLDVAVAMGVWRPVILLPSAWTVSQSADHLRTVLAHESTHILNCDLQWIAVTRALFVTLWANPLFWLIKRRLRLDQEALADAAAAEVTSRQRYAEQLVAWARETRRRPAMHFSSAVGLWEGPSQLRQRIALLLNDRFTVLRDCSRQWRIASVAVCGIVAIVLSLVTLQPGKSAPPTDADRDALSDADAAAVDAAIKTLCETKGIGDQRVLAEIGKGSGEIHVADDWAVAIRTLADIGRPAVPSIITALDKEDRDHPISKLAFALRAIGDPRAVPALIRAVPRTLVPSRSDYGLRTADPNLLIFMKKHDLTPKGSDDDFDYGRSLREVVGALRKLTGANQQDMDLNWVHLGETETQRRIQRKLFHDLAERWAAWWSKNWQRFEVGEAYAVVNLPPLKEAKEQGPRATVPPQGPNYHLTEGQSGWIVQSAHDGKKRCFVDLDTCRETSWPKDIPSIKDLGKDQQRILKWAENAGFDLMGITYQPPGTDAPLYCLEPVDMKVWQITPDQQRELPRAIKGEMPYPLDHPVDRLVPVDGGDPNPAELDLGGTAFLFLTREGTAGLLRMTAQVTDTNMPVGQPSSPNDQFSSVGFYRGAKVSFSFIAEAGNDAKAATRPIGTFELRTGPVVNDKPVAPSLAGYPAAHIRPGSLTVEGRCKDENGNAIADANVALFYRNFSTKEYGLVTQSKSDATGAFTFSGLENPDRSEAGNVHYVVIAWKEGRASLLGSMAPGMPRRNPKALDIVMPPAATLTGRVTDASENPIAGAVVRFDWILPRSMDGVLSARTDANGKFTVSDLRPIQPADYTRQIDKETREVSQPHFLVEHPNFATATVRYERIPDDVHVVMQPAAAITGTVVYDDAKHPAANVRVALQGIFDRDRRNLDSSATDWAEATTDIRGKYRLGALRPGKYNVWATAPDRTVIALDSFELKSGESREAPILTLIDGGFLAGQLVDAATGEKVKIGDEFVSVGVYGPSRPRSGAGHRWRGRVNPDGTFRFRLPPGQQYVYLSGTGSFTVEGENRGAQDVDIRAGETTDIEFRVSGEADADPVETPPAKNGPSDAPPSSANRTTTKSIAQPEPNTITGRVVDEKGQPYAGAEAFLFRINRPDSTRTKIGQKATDAEGKFRFEKVIDVAKEFPDGKISLDDQTEKEFLQVVVRAPGYVSESRVDLRQQVAKFGEIDETKLRRAATLSGRVTGPDGKPVDKALVSVGGLGFALWEGVMSTRTNSDGRFEIKDVAPFDMKEFREKQTEQQGRMNAFRSNKSDANYSVFMAAPVLAVEHPDFASKYTSYEKVPGTQDVTLEPAAVLEGLVVYGDSGKPAAGAVVHADTALPNNTLPKGDEGYVQRHVEMRSDADGKYRFAMLPAGSFDLSVEMPGWVNVGINGFALESGKTTTAPKLVLTKGGVVSIRFIDAKTGKPIELQPDLQASISSHVFPLAKFSRPVWTSTAEANSEGRFELRTPPGKRAIMASGLRVGEEVKWGAQQTPGKFEPTVVDIAEGQTVSLDQPVVSVKELEVTGSVQTTQQIEAAEKAKTQRDSKPPAERSEGKKNGADSTSSKAGDKTGEAQRPREKASTGEKDNVYTAPITISGQAIGKDLQPLDGATIYLASLQPGFKRVAQTVSDKDGKYAFDKIQLPITKADTARGNDSGAFEVFGVAGGYGLSWREQRFFYPHLEHYSNEYVEPDGDGPRMYGSTDPIELDLQFGPATKVRGRVVDDHGKPIANTLLDIRDADSQWNQSDYNTFKGIGDLPALNERDIVPRKLKTRTTDSDGSFEFTALPLNHRFWIWVHPPGFPTRRIWAVTNDTVDTAAKGTNVYNGDIELVFATPRKVPILVVYADTGKPAPKVFVSADGSDGTTDELGQVDLTLPDGEYRVHMLQRIGTPYRRSESSLVVSETLVKERTRAELQPAAVAEISVTDAETGKPLVGVDLWRQEPGANALNSRRDVYGYRSWEVETRISHYEQHRTDKDGKMRVLFEPGQHRIGVGLRAFPDGYDAVDPNGKLVDLEAGKPQSIQFQMRKQDQSNRNTPVKFQLVQNTSPAAEKSEKPEVKRPPGLLGYGDDKPDGKKSIGGSGEMIRFELPEGVTKIKGIRIHGSRYGLPQAPKEDFEITFLNDKLDETLHTEAAPYRSFNRGKEQWVRVAFKNEVELPRKFWVCLNFNAAQTKGVYVSYDTSTNGEYSRVGLPGDTEKPKETDFKGDWMVQLFLAKPEK